MSSLGLGVLRITCLVSRGDWKYLAASHCFEKALPFILPSPFIYGLGIFFFSPCKKSINCLFTDCRTLMQANGSCKIGEKQWTSLPEVLGGRNEKQCPRMTAAGSSVTFAWLGLIKEENTCLGPHIGASTLLCAKPHSGTNHMAIRASCPQPSSSPLFPLLFSLLPPSPRKLLLIFQRKVFKGALAASSLGSECYLLKGSLIFWGSIQRTSSRRWKRD